MWDLIKRRWQNDKHSTTTEHQVCPVHALMESVKETKTQHTWASPPPYVSF